MKYRISKKPGYVDATKDQYVVEQKYPIIGWCERYDLCDTLEEAEECLQILRAKNTRKKEVIKYSD